ncbi:4-coumarate-CoA ligase 2 [Cordyceps militaris CM01]|uniref:4-coumarate-CoA ligase 2 n=1 Tax=Cordyceps militaris (strain CM01) TaxID=983644 RepID=G3JIX7_CORMM|nr:4-coumarate-CoA ligase 2 [Cordyceps militaris CM01]EGX91971.1 4-coumarate-CoA ligase 2 [Cordyceps militaris CM01]
MLFKSAYPDIHGTSATPPKTPPERNHQQKNPRLQKVPPDLTLWQWLFEGPSPAAGCSSPAAGAAAVTREYINTHTNTRLTHAQMRDAAAALSAALVRRGLRPGDVVALVSPNAVTYPVCLHGVMRAGGVPAVTSPAANETEMRHALRTVRARFVMCAPETLPVVRAAAAKEGIDKECVFVFADEEDRVDGHVSLSQLVEEGARKGCMPPVGLPTGMTSAQATAFLCFSSGTTGLPKAVIISHANIIAQCLQLNLAYTHSPMALGLLPFYHISGLVRAQVHCLVSHTSIAVVPRFTMPALLSAISTHRIAEVNLVPPILIRLAHDATVAAYDLSCVERWATGAAPVSPEVLALLAARFPGTGFKQGYGMTETTACATTHPPHLYDFKHGRSVGTLVAGTVMKVVNEDGVAVGVGERGEGHRFASKDRRLSPDTYTTPRPRPPPLTPRASCAPATRAPSRPQLTIHDRIKEMIKVKGAQVAPAELEDLLLGHPAVADAAVVGVPDDYAGERPFAFVVLRPGADAARAPDDVVAYVKEARTRSKWLAGVRVVHAIPKSPSGKILRRILRDEYKKDAQAQRAKL